jgi:hypothetical protein
MTDTQKQKGTPGRPKLTFSEEVCRNAYNEMTAQGLTLKQWCKATGFKSQATIQRQAKALGIVFPVGKRGRPGKPKTEAAPEVPSEPALVNA